MTNSSVVLENLRFHAYHGVLPQERLTGNDYLVDVRIKYDFSKALESDDVEDTINYAEVFGIVSREMGVPSKLIEYVAGRIARGIFSRYPSVEEVFLKILKQNPPMGADCKGAGVTCTFVR